MNEDLQLADIRERFCPRRRRSVPLARGFARQALADWRFGERTGDALLCVSELATNALRHGVPPGRGFLLRLQRKAATVRIEVHDSGGGRPYVPPEGERDESGRGLLLVQALSDAWGVGPRVPGKVVWCELSATGR